MKLFVVLNCAAGALLVGDQTELSRMISEAFQVRDVEADIVCARGGDIADMVRFARDRAEFDGVVIGGGDGTISAATDVLIGSNKPLGILPLGTLNHFARDLGIPPTVEAAIAVIAAGHIRAVDLGSVNGAIFVNNSSVGVYPYMVADRDRRRSAFGLSKWPAMALAGLRVLKRFPFRRLTMNAEGSATRYRTPILFVGNNEYDLSLFSLGRRQQLNLGRLQIYVVRAQSRLGVILVQSWRCSASAGRPTISISSRRRIRRALAHQPLPGRARRRGQDHAATAALQDPTWSAQGVRAGGAETATV